MFDLPHFSPPPSPFSSPSPPIQGAFFFTSLSLFAHTNHATFRVVVGFRPFLVFLLLLLLLLACILHAGISRTTVPVCVLASSLAKCEASFIPQQSEISGEKEGKEGTLGENQSRDPQGGRGGRKRKEGDSNSIPYILSRKGGRNGCMLAPSLPFWLPRVYLLRGGYVREGKCFLFQEKKKEKL